MVLASTYSEQGEADLAEAHACEERDDRCDPEHAQNDHGGGVLEAVRALARER
jgi:hypothetical protein